MRLFTCVVILVFSAACHSQEVFTFANAPGPHGVGVQIVEQHDDSRSFPSGAAGEHRPIQTVIWYPAEKGGKPWSYNAYLKLIASADNFSRTTGEQQAMVDADILGKTDGKSAAQIAAARGRATWAVPGAPAEAGRFPIVIYAPSISGDSFQNSDLCEYLASHGYVVIASPGLGTDRRNQSLNLIDIRTQATDIRFLITFAASLPQADSSKVVVVGYSVGGLSSVFAAAQDKRITALVELDGSVRYFNRLVQQAGDVTADRLAVPMLYLAHRPLFDAVENQIKYKADLSGSLINEMQASDLYLFNINAMDHRDFSSWFIRIRDAATFEDYTPAEVSTGYGWMARYVLEFLNAYASSDASAKKFLAARPEDNGVPRHLMERVIQRQK